MKSSDPPRGIAFQALQQALAHQALSDFEMTVAMDRAAEIQDIEEGYQLLKLPDDHLAILGWTRRGLVIAIDAKKGKANAPLYCHNAQDRHKERLRIVAGMIAAPGAAAARGYCLPTASPIRKVIEASDPDEKK